jgi:hypothetical protein
MKLNGPIKPDTLAQDLIGTDLWFPVRTSGDDGHEFILPSEWAVDAQHATERARNTDRTTGPSWSHTNPVVRIAQMKIIACEIKDR